MTELTHLLSADAAPLTPDWLVWLSLALVAGGLLGEAARRLLDVPRIAGYAAAGLGVALVGLGPAADALPASVRLVVDLALALLLFELGTRVDLRWLRANPALLWTSALEALAGFLALAAVLSLAGFPRDVALAGAAVLGPASGTMAVRATAELRSAGQVTERLRVMAALDTVYAVLAAKGVSSWILLDRQGDWLRGIMVPIYTLGGSVLVAIGLYLAVARVVRLMDVNQEDAALLLIGLVVLALSVARVANVSTILVPLLAGALLRNSTERPCVWPRHFGSAGGMLVLLLFVIAGACAPPLALVTGSAIALGALAARTLARAAVFVLGARLGGIDERQAAALAVALSPVSCTSLVLLADLHASVPQVAQALAPAVTSAVALMALGGPAAMRWGLQLARELPPAEQRHHREAP